jgi:hypothetical protein
MATKAEILREIRRLAQESDGKPPGRLRFENETGIGDHEWSGRFWVKWSDALIEAGYAPNSFASRLDEEPALKSLAVQVRQHRRMPTNAELKMSRQADASIPTAQWFQKTFGSKSQIRARLIEFCDGLPEFADVVGLMGESEPTMTGEIEGDRSSSEKMLVLGYVYLLKSGKYYKIGRSVSVGRRVRELAIQLPQKVTRVHAISTDDPVGIERYWHLRFADRRVRPDAEWFELSAAEVAAFRRRKFQ